MSVPEFKTYFPSIDRLNRKQLAFYKKLEQSLDSDNYLEVNGNISYVFLYIYKIISTTKRHDKLREKLIKISQLYKAEEKISDACLYWSCDCLLSLKKYEQYLEESKTKIEDILSTKRSSTNFRLNMQKHLGYEAYYLDVYKMAGNIRNSNFIINHQKQYKDKLRVVFSNYSEKRGGWFHIFEKELIGNFINTPIYYQYECKDKYYDKFKIAYFKFFYGKDKWIERLKILKPFKAFHRWMIANTLYQYPEYLFGGVPLKTGMPPSVEVDTACYYVAEKTIKEIQILSKEAENQVRSELGFPKVGEGWISETLLFKKLEEKLRILLMVNTNSDPS